jgi:hypothetical protein
VNFSADGRQAITASADKTAAIWDVPIAPNPIPAWLPELAEAVGGQKLNTDGIPEPVSWSDYAAFKARVAAFSDSEPFADIARKYFSD